VTQATSRAVAQPARSQPHPQPRSWLRVVSPSRRIRKAPFIVLLATVVIAGMLALVLLSVAVNQQAFTLAKLERSTGDLTVRHSTLRAEVDRLSSPERIERIAAGRGLEPVRSARIVAWPGQAGGQPAKAGTGGAGTRPQVSAGGRLWTADDPHPLKHYLAQP
jgi:cell division protein FtsL